MSGKAMYSTIGVTVIMAIDEARLRTAMSIAATVPTRHKHNVLNA